MSEPWLSMSEPWLSLARWAIVVAWALVAVLIGDPVVRRVFRAAGDGVGGEAGGGGNSVPPDAGGGDAPDVNAVPAAGESDVGVDGASSTIEAAGARLRGGKAVGWLERLATFATILAGFPAGIAAVVAVKGLARYPDLKASDGTAERFILGTFSSLLVAAGGAGAAHWCLGLLP